MNTTVIYIDRPLHFFERLLQTSTIPLSSCGWSTWPTVTISSRFLIISPNQEYYYHARKHLAKPSTHVSALREDAAAQAIIAVERACRAQ
jgi:hypothetical protein